MSNLANHRKLRKSTRSSARRKLDEALKLDRSLNESSGKALELMYAILPKNSSVIAKEKQRSKAIQPRSRSADSKPRSQFDKHINESSQDQNNFQQELLAIRKQTLNNISNNSTRVNLTKHMNQIVDEEANVNTEAQTESDQNSSDSNEVSFRMTVDPGDDDLDGDSSDVESSHDHDSSDEAMDGFEPISTSGDSRPVVDSQDENLPIDFTQFQERPEVKEFMVKMYKATVGKQPSIVQEQARTVNNIKLQLNAGKGQTSSTRKQGNSTPVNQPIVVGKARSDSTLYRPALKMKRLEKTAHSPDYVHRLSSPKEVEISNFINGVRIGNFPQDAILQNDNNHTTNFISAYNSGQAVPIPKRMEEAPAGPSSQVRSLQPQDSRNVVMGQATETVNQQQKARQIADRAILEAERLKGAIASPTGNSTVNSKADEILPAPPVDHNFSDDNANNFCQVSNHVDLPTTIKVAKGAFVEVSKIAPPKSFKIDETDKSIQLTSKDGKSFWLPYSDKESNKIHNFKQWEQAFKVYAAIYTKFNPHRGAEIYQYVHSISLAASSYHWDNVAYYDYHFQKTDE